MSFADRHSERSIFPCCTTLFRPATMVHTCWRASRGTSRGREGLNGHASSVNGAGLPREASDDRAGIVLAFCSQAKIMHSWCHLRSFCMIVRHPPSPYGQRPVHGEHVSQPRRRDGEEHFLVQRLRCVVRAVSSVHGVVGAGCSLRRLAARARARGVCRLLRQPTLSGFKRPSGSRKSAHVLRPSSELSSGLWATTASMTDVQLDVDRGEQKLIVCPSSGQGQK